MNANAALELSISGMTCDSCVRHVTDALRGVDGVGDARVDLQRGRARVEYDPARTTPERMVGAVDEAGYGAAIVSGGAAQRLPARRGCGCASCA